MKLAIFKYACVLSMTLFTGAALMVVSHKVRGAEVKIARLDRAITQEHENIRNLKAEWAYLTDPARIELLATKYLDLAPPVPLDVVSDFSSIPHEYVSSPDEGVPSSVIMRDASAATALSAGVRKIAYASNGGAE